MPSGAFYSHVLVCIPSGEVIAGEFQPIAGPGTVSCPAGSSPVYREGYLVSSDSSTDLEALLSGQSVLSLTTEEGIEIAAAVLGIWAIAWGFKILARFINHDEGNENETT